MPAAASPALCREPYAAAKALNIRPGILPSCVSLSFPPHSSLRTGQTPFLFSGSVRLNMDPFARFDDAAIWAALEAVQMRTYIAGLPGGEAERRES